MGRQPALAGRCFLQRELVGSRVVQIGWAVWGVPVGPEGQPRQFAAGRRGQ